MTTVDNMKKEWQKMGKNCLRCGCKLDANNPNEKIYCADCSLTIEMENAGEIRESTYD